MDQQLQPIASKIFYLRGDQIILDEDLADLYQVETRILKQSVRRNIDRFPKDFMFELSYEEWNSLRSQNVILEREGRGKHSKYRPFAFTEQGVAMLSGILRSERAVEVNIAIMRTFVHLRKWMEDNKSLANKIKSLEKKYDEQFQAVFKAIQQLIKEDNKPRKPIGFETGRESIITH
jgi:ORF6N domain-containing protein